MMSRQLYCSFCGKAQNEVFYLVSGPSVFICDECVSACAELVTEKKLAAGATAVIGVTTEIQK